MANEAGINLILKAPEVKSMMDEVIDSWKEITEQEKKANEQLKEYHANVSKQLAGMKAMALENQKILDAVKQLKKGTEEAGEAAVATTEKQTKGIFATIKAYFQQKAELKDVERQIRAVGKELDTLDLKQRALFLGARRGNKESLAEYKANEARIKSLNGTLADLHDKQDGLSASVQLTNNRFAGLAKAFNVVKAVGVAAFQAIALAGTLVFALTVAIGKQNDVVRNQFKKTADAFKAVRTELSDALAPVAFALGSIIEEMGKRFAAFLKENSASIQEWAINFGGNVAYISAYIGAAIPFIGNLFKRLAKDIIISATSAEVFSNILTLQFGKAADNIEKIKKALIEKGELEDAIPINPIEAANAAYDAMVKKLQGVNFEIRNLTKEQLEALKKMQAEYKKITDEINKQIEALEIQEAGPIAGIIVKSEIAAKAMEIESARFVDLARKLQKSQDDIDEIISKFNRLIDATRNQAQAQVVDALTASLKKLDDQIADNAAKDTGTEEELKLQRTLGILAESRAEVEATLDNLKKTGEFYVQNKELVDSITRRSLDAIAQLESDALESFSTTQSTEKAKKRVAELKKQLEEIKKAQEAIIDFVNSDDRQITDEKKQELLIEFTTNQASLDKVLAELGTLKTAAGEEIVTPLILDTTEAKQEFDEFGNKKLTFKADVEIGNPLSGLDKFGNAIEEAFGNLEKRLNDIFGKELGDKIAVNLAFIQQTVVSSIDAQIDAVNREISTIDDLINKREESIDRLEKDLELEAGFKEAGLANDYNILRDQLDAERNLLEANLQRKEEAEKKAAVLAEKRQKIQAIQDSAAQVSALTTAVANTFKGFSTIPLVGQILAIASIAAMFAAFAASKIQAGKLARAYTGSRRMGETFGELAPGEGYDDRPGHDRGLTVVDRHGRTRGMIGGDEMLMKESVSKQHRGFLWHLNQNEDKFRQMDLMRLFEGSKPVPIDHSGITRYNRTIMERLVVINNQGGITEETMRKAISKAVEKQTQDLTNYFESRPTYRDASMKEYYKETSKSSQRIKS